MSRLSFTEALDQALELLEQGHPLEYCVRQFPEYADELRPLLQVSDDLHRLANAPLPVFDKSTVEPNWEAILASVPQDKPSLATRYRAAFMQWLKELQRHPVQRYSSLAAALLILFVLSWQGSKQSDPHSPLYPIKRAVEQVEMVAALDLADRAELHIEFARRRFDELERQATLTRRIEQPLLDEALTETHQAVHVAKQAGVGQELYTELSRLLSEADSSIDQLKERVESPAPDALDNAGETVSRLRDDLENVAVAESGTPTPTATPTAVRATPTATRTATPTATAVRTPAVTPMPVDDAPDDVVVPAPTKTPAPTSVPPTQTPAPTSTPTTPPVTAVPTRIPTPVSTRVSTPLPTAVPTQEPTPEPTPKPTQEPTPEPTPEPTAVPTQEPTAVPTQEPTAVPTQEPTPEPTAVPTEAPTTEPTAPTQPTETPTQTPTEAPTPEPTAEPTQTPTEAPTPEPTQEPTPEPTAVPTEAPTEAPTPEPTAEPTPTGTPGETPTPTQEPIPTVQITVTIIPPDPTQTVVPTAQPTEIPAPTILPTDPPAETPTTAPAPVVTETATAEPTPEPSQAPAPPPSETATSAAVRVAQPAQASAHSTSTSSLQAKPLVKAALRWKSAMKKIAKTAGHKQIQQNVVGQPPKSDRLDVPTLLEVLKADPLRQTGIGLSPPLGEGLLPDRKRLSTP